MLCFTCDQPDVIDEHAVEGEDVARGCVGQALVPAEPGGGGDCGAMVGYVDDGAYSYAHSDPTILYSPVSMNFWRTEWTAINLTLMLGPPQYIQLRQKNC